MLNELFWILFGGLVGWVAAILQQEYSPKRVAMFIVSGMIGGVLGGSLGSLLGAEALASATGMMFSVFGAIAFVAMAALVADKNSE